MQDTSATRILIADDHKLIADLCKSFLEPEYKVVGVVTDGSALIKEAAALKPDIIILDISMPRINGLDAGAKVKGTAPATKLIYLTMSFKPEVAAEAFRRGAAAFVLKQSGLDELRLALRSVVAGESYLSPIIAKETVTYLLHHPKNKDQKRITRRQSEILQLLAQGMSMKEIGSNLDVSPGTVAFHKYRMMKALGLKSSAELISYAVREQLVTEESAIAEITLR